MRMVKASELRKALNVSRHTMRDWIRRDPTMAVRKGRDNWIRLDVLAKRPGMDIVTALTITQHEWVRAIDLARWAGIPRRTVSNWCRTRTWFAHRVGRIWYVSPESLGATPEQAEILKKWSELGTPGAQGVSR